MKQDSIAVDVAPLLEHYSRQEGQAALIAILQDIQEEHGYLPEAALEAKALLGEEASTIGRFCGIDDDGTVPGRTGLPGVRRLADKRWMQIQNARRKMAALLDKRAEE